MQLREVVGSTIPVAQGIAKSGSSNLGEFAMKNENGVRQEEGVSSEVGGNVFPHVLVDTSLDVARCVLEWEAAVDNSKVFY